MENNKIYDLSEFVKKYRCHPEGDCGASWLIKDITSRKGIEPEKLKHAERVSKPIKDTYFGCDKECIMNGLLLDILEKEEKISDRTLCQTQAVEVYKIVNGIADINEAWRQWTDSNFQQDGKSLAKKFDELYERIRPERERILKQLAKQH